MNNRNDRERKYRGIRRQQKRRNIANNNVISSQQNQDGLSLEHESNGNGLIVPSVLQSDRVFGASQGIVVPAGQRVEYRLNENEYDKLVNVRELGFWYSASAFCFSWCLSILYDLWKGVFESNNKDSNAWALFFFLGILTIIFLALAVKLSSKRKDVVSEIEDRYNQARGMIEQNKRKTFITKIKDFLFDENDDDL
jgi:hypothetical protein